MSGKDRDDTDSRHGGGWLIGIVVALVIYVLSPPLVTWVMDKTGVDPPAPLMWIYYPLGLVYERVAPVKAFYKAYGEMMGVEM